MHNVEITLLTLHVKHAYCFFRKTELHDYLATKGTHWKIEMSVLCIKK